MPAVSCPNCVAEGVDCPLLIGGECLHCGRRDAPISRRVGDAAFRVRFATDSLRWRLRTIRAGVAAHARALVSGVLGADR